MQCRSTCSLKKETILKKPPNQEKGILTRFKKILKEWLEKAIMLNKGMKVQTIREDSKQWYKSS